MCDMCSDEFAKLKSKVVMMYNEKAIEKMATNITDVFGLSYGVSDPYDVVTCFALDFGLLPEELDFLNKRKRSFEMVLATYLTIKGTDIIEDIRDFRQFVLSGYREYKKYEFYEAFDNTLEKFEKGELEVDKTTTSFLSYALLAGAIALVLALFVIAAMMT